MAQRRENRWLWILAGLMPVAIGLSFPVLFTAGGLSLVVANRLWRRQGTTSEWRPWVAWNVTLVAGFAFWFLLSDRVQAAAESVFMGNYWLANFPPISRPWKLPLWMLRTHASDFLAFPVGGPNWEHRELVVVVAGFWGLWRRGNRELAAILLARPG